MTNILFVFETFPQYFPQIYILLCHILSSILLCFTKRFKELKINCWKIVFCFYNFYTRNVIQNLLYLFYARQSSICRIIAVSQHQPSVQLQQQLLLQFFFFFFNSSLRQTFVELFFRHN